MGETRKTIEISRHQVNVRIERNKTTKEWHGYVDFVYRFHNFALHQNLINICQYLEIKYSFDNIGMMQRKNLCYNKIF